ncbi:conserved hypothetical protein [Gammaproteobacteria bacterium]
MAITLGALTLPEDIAWIDEFKWSPTSETATYTLTGALLVQTATKQAGRPITLVGSESTWLQRGVLKALRDLADTPGTEMTLTLNDSRTFNVAFRHSDAPAIDASPLFWIRDYDNEWPYVVTIKLMEV